MLYLDRSFKVFIESGFNNLINDNFDVLGNAQTSVAYHNGDDCLKLSSGSIKLNNHYPNDIESGEIYRSVFRLYDIDASTVNIGVGNSVKAVDLTSGILNSIEVYYRKGETTPWKIYINGNEGGFSPPTSGGLRPTMTVPTGKSVYLTEIKNQVFKKITEDNPPDGQGDYYYSDTEAVPGGNGLRDLQFTDLNTQREIIFSFNDNFNYQKIGSEVFDDLRLWADIDYESSTSGSSANYDPQFQTFI